MDALPKASDNSCFMMEVQFLRRRESLVGSWMNRDDRPQVDALHEDEAGSFGGEPDASLSGRRRIEHERQPSGGAMMVGEAKDGLLKVRPTWINHRFVGLST